MAVPITSDYYLFPGPERRSEFRDDNKDLNGVYTLIRETDISHEKNMNKLDGKIVAVDKKVDRLREDMPIIVREANETILKDNFFKGVKFFFKTFGILVATFFALTLLWVAVSNLFPDLMHIFDKL